MIKTKSEILYNKTTLLLYPALQLPDPMLLKNGFKKCYISDHGYDVRWDYDGCLYLLFEPQQFNEDFEEFSNFMRKHSLFKDEYDLNGKVMFVMQIPDKYRDILIKFKKGKYSEFNKDYVTECIPMLRKGNISKAWKIFNQDLSLRREWEKELGYKEGELIKYNSEVYPIPEPIDEIYRFDEETILNW